jgi:hypothetical protein
MPAVLAEITYPGVTALQYEEVNQRLRERLGDDCLPAGLLVHTAVIDNDGLRVVEVWESGEALAAFAQSLVPAVKEAGIAEPPEPPRVTPLYNLVVRA